MTIKTRDYIYEGPSRGISLPYDFAEFVHSEVTRLLKSSEIDEDFVEEGLEYKNLMHNYYYFNRAGFAIEHEYNLETRKSRISNLFRLCMDVSQRLN